MAAPSAASILRVPGSLIWNPTTNSGAAPYGGTYLGTVHSIAFEMEPVTREIWAEEMGGLSDVIFCGERGKLKAVLRHPDSDGVGAIAPNSAGSGGFRFRVQGAGAYAAGNSLFGHAGRLLFAPRADTAHPALIIYAAVPCFEEAAALQLSFGKEYGLAVVFRVALDTSGRGYQSGILSTLTVT
ncbi:MAG TPA: hypothetical protein DEH78_20245 [Solibacterales bacterium]|nr:hypothetical protein [Bryobacterales bacterium]